MTIEIVETPVGDQLSPAVSWPSIAGGALVAIATTLILFSLGSSLGLSLASPWDRGVDTAARVGAFTGIWLVVVQWLSSAVGGYLAGRTRVRWAGLHGHEVFFRDTAHGLMTWSLATVIMATVAAWAGAGAVGLGTDAAKASAPLNLAYDADRLFRTQSGDPTLAPVREEAARTLAAAAASGGLNADDRNWLTAAVAARTGVPTATATSRIDAVLDSERRALDAAKRAADEGREAAAKAGILAALSLVVGAFIASVAAAVGGQLRDKHP
jgi:hypothetical protein